MLRVFSLGQAPLSVIAMYSFLVDRHLASDFDGALTVNILKVRSDSTAGIHASRLTIDKVVFQSHYHGRRHAAEDKGRQIIGPTHQERRSDSQRTSAENS